MPQLRVHINPNAAAFALPTESEKSSLKFHLCDRSAPEIVVPVAMTNATHAANLMFSLIIAPYRLSHHKKVKKLQRKRVLHCTGLLRNRESAGLE